MVRFSLAAAVTALFASGACTSSTTNVVEPTVVKCDVTVPESLPSLQHTGGPGSIQVETAAECVWNASSGAAWIALTNASGQGPGTLTFTAAANPTGRARSTRVAVGDSGVEVSQSGAPCQFRFTPSSASIGAAGGDGTVEIETLAGCDWTARSNAPWLTVVGSPSGSGGGTLRYRVAPNSGVSARQGELTIGGAQFVVSQGAAAPACTPALDSTERSIGAAGGVDDVAVMIQAGCSWTASSNAPWIAIAGSAGGTGPGSVRLNIQPNTGPARTGVVTIAGLAYTVRQASLTCSFAISPGSVSAPAGGATAAVQVSAPGGCQWAAVSDADWIAVTSGASGSGNGAVGLTIDANAGSARTGTVTIAGQTFTVTQAGAAPLCTFALGASSGLVAAAGGTVDVAVTAGVGCAWSADAEAPWITVTSGSSGSGNGVVSLAVAGNGGPGRVGTVIIAGETFTVTQEGAPAPVACSFSLDPLEQAAPGAGGAFDVEIGTTPGCDWSASTGETWIEFTGASSGTGSGTLSYAVLALPDGTTSRDGTITISGETLEVRQSTSSIE